MSMRIALVALLLIACKSEPRTPRGSCQTAATCEDYQGDGKFVDGQRAACKGVGTWSDAACPTANLLGSCRETHGWTRTRHHYVGTSQVIDKIKVECGAYGTWVEPK
ncbi:MAG TPA: hypothetical protein VFO79_13895 [Xanthomonadales bacterium]|nr:hypothetical protein [Xanthomonadales bacterium]